MYIHEIGRIDADPYGSGARRRRCASAPAPDAPFLSARRQVAVARQEAGEVRADADRPDAGTAAAVRNAERLVQVEVRDVGAELAGRGQSDERIQVRAVDVHLTAVLVDDRAQSGRCPTRTRRASTGT
jgi:hypothetical protein